MQRREIRSPADDALVERLAGALRARGALAGIDAAALAAFVRQTALVELEPGEALIREGEPATPEVYLLIEGALVVQSKGAQLARLDRSGDVVGEAAVVLGSKRNADVLAESAVRALVVPARTLALPEFTDVAAGVRGALLRDDWIQY